MPRILPHHLDAAQIQIEPWIQSEILARVDELHRQQPLLLTVVLALTRFGASNAQVDIPLRILLVLYQAVQEAGAQLRLISESDLEWACQRVAARIHQMEQAHGTRKAEILLQQVRAFHEPALMHRAFSLLKAQGIEVAQDETEKMILLAVFQIVEAISLALRG